MPYQEPATQGTYPETSLGSMSLYEERFAPYKTQTQGSFTRGNNASLRGFPELQKRIEVLSGKRTIEAAAASGMMAWAKSMDKFVEREIAEIYHRPVPTRGQQRAFEMTGKKLSVKQIKKGRRIKANLSNEPLWRRKQWLSMPRQISLEGSDSVTIRPNVMARGYANTRHGLATTRLPSSWMPKKPALGVKRKNPYIFNAVMKSNYVPYRAFGQAFMRRLGASKR